MADGEEPKRPRPPLPPTPGQPIPRLWKAEPEPDDEPEGERKSRKERLREEKEREAGGKPDDRAVAKGKPATAKSSSGKAKATEKNKEKPKPKGTLLEETPELDTYQSRQRARFLIGTLVVAIASIGIYLFFQSFGGRSADEENLVDEGSGAGGPVASSPPPPKADTSDLEARNLIATARQLARNGKTEGAVASLNKVVKSYPKTASAKEAREALDRPGRNLPLFLDEKAVVATNDAGKAPAADGAAVVTVDASSPPTLKPGGSGDAQLQLLPNPAEAPRSAPPARANQPTVAMKPLPAGFQPREETGVHSSGWPNQVISDRDGATLVLIPAGAYTQGRNDGTPDEAPEHKVNLGPFYMDQHEVTVRQWNYYLKETGKKSPARPPAKGEAGGSAANEEEPAVNVSAREARAYCDWAGKRLPTEAQWEAAARTTDGRLYPWGSNAPVWSRPRAARQIDPVMSYELDMSPYGVYDLAGNAFEWTADWYDSKYYLSLKGQAVSNPTGPASSRARPPMMTVKGGSKGWYAAWREGQKVDTKLPFVGFRGVLVVEDSAPAAAAPAPIPGGRPANPTPPSNPNGVVPF